MPPEWLLVCVSTLPQFNTWWTPSSALQCHRCSQGATGPSSHPVPSPHCSFLSIPANICFIPALSLTTWLPFPMFDHFLSAAQWKQQSEFVCSFGNGLLCLVERARQQLCASCSVLAPLKFYTASLPSVGHGSPDPPRSSRGGGEVSHKCPALFISIF
jgi:hypothetical protein